MADKTGILTIIGGGIGMAVGGPPGVLIGAGIGAGAGAALSAAETVSEALPVFEELVEVAVHGAQQSNKRRLFEMAMAVALGQVQSRGFLMPSFYTAVEYDMMGKSVTVTLAYTYSGLIETSYQFLKRTIVSDPIYQSVDEDLFAGHLDEDATKRLFQDLNLPDAPGTLMAVGSPTFGQINDKCNDPNLPLNSVNASFNPAPPEGGTRGTYLQSLVYAALASPCLPIPDASVNPIEEAGSGNFEGDTGTGGDIGDFSGQLSVAEVIRRLLGG